MTQSARTRTTVAAVTFVLLASVTAAWWFESHTPSPATSTGSPASGPTGSSASTTTSVGSYRIRISQDGKVLASYSLADLEAMGLKQVVLQGGTERGPVLLTVLARAGARDFTTITIIGSGARDSGRLEIPVADVGPDTVLDIAKRGTVKVAGPNIPYAKRVRDITEIQVK